MGVGGKRSRTHVTVGNGRSLARRTRVLAHLQPILDIERDKNPAASAGGSPRDWASYDTRLLSVAAIDAVASESGLHPDGGVPRDRVLRALVTEAKRCAPDGAVEEHAEVAQWVLDRLLNTQEAGTGFRVPVTDPALDYKRTALRVTVLYEQVASDGETILVFAADAAINLLLVTVDFDLEDAQVAADAVLKVQLDSGRWQDAVQTAENALRLTRSYRDQLRGRLATVRRDIRQIDWESTVEPLLARANTHIGGRIGAEQALREHSMKSATTEGDPVVRTEAASVAEMLEEAIRTLSELLTDVVEARGTFRAAQSEQSFRPPAPVGLINVEEDVLVPFARLRCSAASSAAQSLIAAFARPFARPVVSMGRVLDVLLERPRDVDDESVVVIEDELADVASRFARFSDQDWDHARGRFDEVGAEPVRLSSLLVGLEESGALLVALLALRAYDASGSPARGDSIVEGVCIVEDSQMLDHPSILGPDLIVSRPAADHMERNDAQI